MKRTSSPKPLSLLDAERASFDPRVKRAVEALADYFRDPVNPEPSLSMFDEKDIATINRLARRKAQHPFDEREFVRMMERTRPLVAQPQPLTRPLTFGGS